MRQAVKLPLTGMKKMMVYGGLLACMAQGMLLQDTAFAQRSEESVKLYNQGIRAYQQGNPAEALRKFTKATEIDPMYADAFYNMGSIHYQQMRYEQARAAFQSALALMPNDSQARYNLGLALEKLKRYNEAVNVLTMIPANDAKFKDAKAKIDELRTMMRANGEPVPAAKPATASGPSSADAQKLAQISQNGSTQPRKMMVSTFASGFDGPTGMTIGPGGFMYVANYSKNLIYKVGAEGQKSVFVQEQGLKGPIGIVFNPKTNELYVANYLQNTVSRISPDAKVSVLASGLKKPYNLFLDTVNNALFISEQETNSVSRIELP